MNLTEIIIADGCMRLEAFRSIETRRITGRDRKTESTRKASLPRRRRFTRRQITELFFENCIGWELTPLKYNSKLMNSIWGLYNRYSVHNFKKNADAEEGARGGVAAAIWGAILENRPPAANAAATTIADVPRIMSTGSGL